MANMKISEGTMAYLIESELERASLVLAAKDITDRLQKMAEDLAKVEADDIMPILDQLREVFGQDAAEQFNTVATTKVRSTIEALKDAKQGIGSEIDRLEKGVATGVVPNDMALDSEEEETEEEPSPEVIDNDEEQNDDLTSAEDAEGVVPDLDFDTDAENTGPALGRVRKESALPKGGRKLSESRNPDALILREFRTKLNEGLRPIAAARDTAKKFDVDVEEVSRIVSEAFALKKTNESIDPARKAELQRKGYKVVKDNKGKHFWARPEQKTGGLKKDAEIQTGSSNNEIDAWKDLDAHVKMNEDLNSAANSARKKRNKEKLEAERPFKLQQLKKDGTPSGMRDSLTHYKTKKEAMEYVEKVRKLNPGKTLRYTLDGTEV